MSASLHISNVFISFSNRVGGGRTADGNIYVINGLDLELKQGLVTSLVGGNGVGKTTLFNLVSGLLRPDEGEISIRTDTRHLDCTREQPWNIAKAGVGRMFQGVRVFSDLSVMDNLLIQARKGRGEAPWYRMVNAGKSRRDDKQLAEYIAEKLEGFDEFTVFLDEGKKPASSLSFAKQRLLSLAGLMLGEYELLLLDEPTSGLSPGSFDTLYRCLRKTKEEGRTVFLIEHNMEFIREAADQCHYMAEGKIMFSGTPDEVLENKDVKESYLL